MKIHFILAMQGEAQHVIDALSLKKIDYSDGRLDIYQGEHNSHDIKLFVNHKDENDMDRLGTVQVGLLTYKAVQYQKPDLIINVGTCGGIYDHGIRLFDIICGQNYLIYHDRFTGDSENSIKQSLRFSPCVNLENIFNAKNVKHGVIASSNSLLVGAKSWGLIHKHHVLCLDMEAAAVSEIASDLKIPFIALKVVTDDVYEVNPIDAYSQFEQNFHPAMNLLALQVPKLLFALNQTHNLFQEKSADLNDRQYF